MVRQPWFIGAVIGTVGGALWFALCVFSLWLCRRRQRRRKHPRSNGIVSGKNVCCIQFIFTNTTDIDSVVVPVAEDMIHVKVKHVGCHFVPMSLGNGMLPLTSF